MVTTAEFYAEVSAEVRRGTSLDTHIPRKVRQAMRWMEEQHSFLHMERFATMILTADATYPRTIALPSGYKSMNFWRIKQNVSDTGAPDAVGAFAYLTRIDPHDQISVDVDCPTAYWQDGMDYFWLDNTPDKDYSAEMSYVAYSTLPSDLTQSPYILQNFEGILLHKTCALMAPLMRDKDFKIFHQDELNGAMKSAVDADVEARQSDQIQSVQFGSQYSQQIALNRSR